MIQLCQPSFFLLETFFVLVAWAAQLCGRDCKRAAFSKWGLHHHIRHNSTETHLTAAAPETSGLNQRFQVAPH